ncbi:MAG: C_GCAxxG_C_C family protein [Spirochaetes bacterium]|nr:C_GCAxxG_C_C family protein [Spirochaetota bacterium]
MSRKKTGESAGNSIKVSRGKFLKYTGLGILSAALTGTGVLSYLNSTKLSAVNYMLRMGHCAPSVMKTLLNADGSSDDDIIKLAGSLSGGIGNSGAECGAVTAGIIYLGLRNSDVSRVVSAGKEFMKSFHYHNGFLSCAENKNGMRSCIKAIACSPESVIRINKSGKITLTETDKAVLNIFRDSKFHCAAEVFNNSGIKNPQILKASQGFIGGTCFAGKTCSALAAGVMVVGLRKGEIENSYLRVIHMINMMDKGNEWLGNEVNSFHRSINLGNMLVDWFGKTFNTHMCGELTGMPFSSKTEVQIFFRKGGIRKCRNICDRVALKVAELCKSV